MLTTSCQPRSIRLPSPIFSDEVCVSLRPAECSCPVRQKFAVALERSFPGQRACRRIRALLDDAARLRRRERSSEPALAEIALRSEPLMRRASPPIFPSSLPPWQPAPTPPRSYLRVFISFTPPPLSVSRLTSRTSYPPDSACSSSTARIKAKCRAAPEHHRSFLLLVAPPRSEPPGTPRRGSEV